MKIHFGHYSTESYYYITAFDSATHKDVGRVCLTFNVENNRFKSDKLIKIIRIETNIGFCNKGIATSLLNETIKTFNDSDIYLNVIPCPRNEEERNKLSVKKLEKFYQKFGFKKTDDILIPTMLKKRNGGVA